MIHAFYTLVSILYSGSLQWFMAAGDGKHQDTVYFCLCLFLAPTIEVAENIVTIRPHLRDPGSPMYRIQFHIGLGFCLHG